MNEKERIASCLTVDQGRVRQGCPPQRTKTYPQQANGRAGVIVGPACRPRKSPLTVENAKPGKIMSLNTLCRSRLVIPSQLRSRALHVRIIESASRNYRVVFVMALHYHAKFRSFFLSRKVITCSCIVMEA